VVWRSVNSKCPLKREIRRPTADESCDGRISVLYNCLEWYKFVNTHLYHSRQLYNIRIKYSSRSNSIGTVCYGSCAKCCHRVCLFVSENYMAEFSFDKLYYKYRLRFRHTLTDIWRVKNCVIIIIIIIIIVLESYLI